MTNPVKVIMPPPSAASAAPALTALRSRDDSSGLSWSKATSAMPVPKATAAYRPGMTQRLLLI
jgi:hypothetical protein